MIDFNKFSILSVMGKKAGNLSDQEYTRTVLANCDKYLEDIKKARAEMLWLTFINGGHYWVRTSDLFRVKEARSHCAKRP